LLSFPGGERSSCLAVQEAYAMERAGFDKADQQRRLCELPAIAKTPTCKKLAERDQTMSMFKDGDGFASADPYIAARMAGK
jgi:hypothetical protein